jgi:hypothetical protein
MHKNQINFDAHVAYKISIVDACYPRSFVVQGISSVNVEIARESCFVRESRRADASLLPDTARSIHSTSHPVLEDENKLTQLCLLKIQQRTYSSIFLVGWHCLVRTASITTSRLGIGKGQHPVRGQFAWTSEFFEKL